MKFPRVQISAALILLTVILLGIQAKPLREGFQQTVSPTSIQIDLNCVPSGSDVNCTASSTNPITTTPPSSSSSSASSSGSGSISNYNLDTAQGMISSTWLSSQPWVKSGEDIPDINPKAVTQIWAKLAEALSKSQDRAQNDSVQLAQITDQQQYTTQRNTKIQEFSTYVNGLFGKVRDEAVAANLTGNPIFVLASLSKEMNQMINTMVNAPQVFMNWAKLQWDLCSKISMNQVWSDKTTLDDVISVGKAAFKNDWDSYWNYYQQNKGAIDASLKPPFVAARQSTQEKFATPVLRNGVIAYQIQ